MVIICVNILMIVFIVCPIRKNVIVWVIDHHFVMILNVVFLILRVKTVIKNV